MDNYFPADVSLRVLGDNIEGAQQLFPVAKQLLSRALQMKRTGSPVVKLFLPLPDGSLVYAYLIGDLKHIIIQPTRSSGEGSSEETEILEIGSTQCPGMLSGVVKPGDGVLQIVDGITQKNPDDTDDYAVHEFHPTSASATVYNLEYAWQDVDRLGVESDPDISSAVMQVKLPKPSMYSGAMKRIVQAIYGIGKTLADGQYFPAQNHYDYRWLRCDGIRKIGGVYWLIRISKDDGVLGMKLPFFECSTDPLFLDALQEIGDVDTFSVVREFGGLPTGKTFPPEGDDRDAAVAAGDVLKMLMPADLAPFYGTGGVTGRFPLFNECGWAFSDLGNAREAHNTTFWYSQSAFATVFNTSMAAQELLAADALYPSAVVAPLSDRAMRAEHWKIVFVGTTATLQLVEAGLLTGSAKQAFDGDYFYTEMLRLPSGFRFPYWGRPPNLKKTEIKQYDELDCPVMVFFRGEVIEVVRHQRQRVYVDGYVSGTIGPIYPGEGGWVFSAGNPPGVDGSWYWDHGYEGGWQVTQSGPIVNPSNPSPTSVEDIDGNFYDPQIVLAGYSIFINDDLHASYPRFFYTSKRYPKQRKRAGAFYSTSLDLRDNRRFDTVGEIYSSDVGGLPTPAGVIFDQAQTWYQEIGLVIPEFVRDGFCFARVAYGNDVTSLVPLVATQLPEPLEQVLLIPDLNNSVVALATINPYSSNKWLKLMNASVFGYEASINAGPTKCGVVQDCVFGFYITGGILPTEQVTPNRSYTGSAGGIDMTGANPTQTTYVGAV